MPTGAEWDKHFESLETEDLKELNKAVNTILDISPMMGKELWIKALAPSIRNILGGRTDRCEHCGSAYLAKFDPEDLCIATLFGTERMYCQDCYDSAVEQGIIDPQGD